MWLDLGKLLVVTFKLNPVVTPIAATILNFVAFIEQINTCFGNNYSAINLTNALFFTPVHKGQKKFAFNWQDQQNTFIVLPQVVSALIHLCF